MKRLLTITLATTALLLGTVTCVAQHTDEEELAELQEKLQEELDLHGEESAVLKDALRKIRDLRAQRHEEHADDDHEHEHEADHKIHLDIDEPDELAIPPYRMPARKLRGAMLAAPKDPGPIGMPGLFRVGHLGLPYRVFGEPGEHRHRRRPVLLRSGEAEFGVDESDGRDLWCRRECPTEQCEEYLGIRRFRSARRDRCGDEMSLTFRRI